MRNCAKVFIILIPFWATFGQQADKVPLPATPAGKHVEAYLRAFNSGEDAMREFFLNHTAKDELQKVPVEQRLSRYRQMHERLGSLELRKVIESRNDHLTALFRTSNGILVNLEFEFSPSTPFGLIGIHLEDVGEEEGARADPKKDNAELIDSVGGFLARSVNAGEFSGVVLIAQNGRLLFQKAYGFADRERRTPNEVETKFNIGSINKAFTALSICQLTSEGKLSFSDPIRKYLLYNTIALRKGILNPRDKQEPGSSEMIAGGAPGLNAAIGWNLSSGYTIVVMSNFDPPSAERIARQISRWLPK